MVQQRRKSAVESKFEIEIEMKLESSRGLGQRAVGWAGLRSRATGRLLRRKRAQERRRGVRRGARRARQPGSMDRVRRTHWRNEDQRGLQ